MKKIKLLVLSLLLFTFAIPFVNAEETTDGETKNKEVNVYIFRGEGCGFCANAMSFFESIEKDYGQYFNLVEYEVWNNQENAALMEQFAEYLNEEVTGVPFIVVGEKTYPGFDAKWGEEIKTEIKKQYDLPEESRTDLMANFQSGMTFQGAGDSEESNETLTAVVIVLILAGVVAFTIFARKEARNSENDEKVKFEIKSALAKKVEAIEDEDESEDEYEEEEEVVEKTTKTTKTTNSSKKNTGNTKKKTATNAKRKK